MARGNESMSESDNKNITVHNSSLVIKIKSEIIS